MDFFEGLYNSELSTIELEFLKDVDLSKSLEVATELIEQCYLDKRNKQLLFQPSIDLEEFHYPIFYAFRVSQGTSTRLPLRTTTVKAIAELYGYENLNEFWSMVVLSFVDYIKKKGIKQANASLLHLKDMFRRNEYWYFKITEPLKDVHLAVSKSDFESRQELIKESPHAELDRTSKELYLNDMYQLVYYGAHMFVHLKKNDEIFKSTHCEAFGVTAEEYEEHIESIFIVFYHYAYVLTIAGIRISALTFCMDNHLIPELTGEGFSFSSSDEIEGSEWRTTSKFEHFKSPEFLASNNPFIINKRGRRREKTPGLEELILKLMADPEYQHPDGTPIKTRIRDEIHFGDYKEKGPLQASSILTRIEEVMEIIEKEKSSKDQKSDSDGTGNLDGE